MADYDAVNADEDPEGQRLEEYLPQDTGIEHQIHTTLQQEQQLADDFTAGGYPTSKSTDARIKELEKGEQTYAAKIVEDQQAIDHWDHDDPHPAPSDPSDIYDSVDAGAGSSDIYDNSSIYDDPSADQGSTVDAE